MNHRTIEDGAVPYHYSLWFEPDLNTFRFRGKAVVKLRFSRAKSSLRLNAKELVLKSARAKAGGAEQEVSFRLEGDSEVVFDFKEPLQGDVELTVEYEGAHNDRLYGFYRARVSQKEYMLSSQFETANARAAFPCLDEPLFKATFDVTLLVDEGLEAVSNMPVKRKAAEGGKVEWAFETTPRMSTYLLYLGVGRFDRLERESGRLKLSVLATRGKKEYTHLALDYGERLFTDLQSYFRVEYPLPKLDMLAIPDFAAGAMENWGAITFRETALLGSEQKSTVIGKQRIAEVIGHELAHMWFGDLVTMEWWDDMWLNESFATYMEYKAVDRQFPEWKAMLKYYLDSVGLAFSADGVRNSHPISVKVETVGEVEELFDAIGYNKGGSVLMMLEDFVGSDVFRDGLTSYIRKHSYGNATKDDLWASIEQECEAKGRGLPVVKVMDDWLTREGYPVVSVREAGEGAFELSQERFTISGNMEGTWKIPVSYLSDRGEGRMLMEGKTARVEANWLKLNYRQAGFYRVAYERKNLQVLGRMVREGKLGDLDAWGIENDLFAFVRSGGMELREYLDFVREYCMDCGYPANVNLSGHLTWLNSLAFRAPFAKKAAELSAEYHGKLLEKLGWEVRPGESSGETRLRNLAITELGLLGDRA
ncbi:MAG: M1 family metallopeptidase, partial [Candidatus Micrarchaeota archaeon]